jgi:hypothetical protein
MKKEREVDKKKLRNLGPDLTKSACPNSRAGFKIN